MSDRFMMGTLHYLLFVRGFGGSDLLFSIRQSLGQKGVILGLLFLLGLEMALLERKQMAATLEALWSHQSLDALK